MSRTTLQSREIRALTGLRGIAACYVMLYHFSLDGLSGGARTVMQHGYMSVDLFFVLSGFVMALTYAQAFRRLPGRRSYFDFLQKRFARVYPLYLFVTLLMAILIRSLLVGGVWPSAGTLTANVLLYQAWGFAASICGPCWSISTEFGAYLFFPFLAGAIVFGRRWWRWTAMIAAVAVLVVVATRSSAQLHEVGAGVRHGGLDIYAPGTLYPLLRCFSEFVMGIAAFPLFVGRSLTSNQPGNRLGLATDLLALLILGLVLVSGSDLALALLCVPLVGLLSYEQGYAARVLRSPVSHWLGLVSYSIYLDHFLLHQLLDKPSRVLIADLHLSHASVLRGILMVGTTMLAATLTYYGIEKPAREKLRYGRPRLGSISTINNSLIASDPPAP